MKKVSSILILIACITLSAVSVYAQGFSVDWWKVSAGAGAISNGQFAVSGTVGQVDGAPAIVTGSYALTGGFWSVLVYSTGVAGFNASRDFSSSTNSNTSTWSYRYKGGLTRDGNYTLLPAFGSAPHEVPWTGSNPDPGAWTLNNDVPMVGVNRSGQDLIYAASPGFALPNDALFMHPGNNELVVVSWLSPTTALANVNFSFSDLDPNGGNGITWFVEVNNAAHTVAFGSFTNGGASGTLSVSNVAVNAGDRINFIVDPNSDYAFDSTRLDASVEMTPAPGLPFQIVSFNKAGSDLLLQYSSYIGQKYAIESSTNLAVGSWTTLPASTNAGNGSLIQYVVTNGFNTPQQFYRILLLP